MKKRVTSGNNFPFIIFHLANHITKAKAERQRQTLTLAFIRPPDEQMRHAEYQVSGTRVWRHWNVNPSVFQFGANLTFVGLSPELYDMQRLQFWYERDCRRVFIIDATTSKGAESSSRFLARGCLVVLQRDMDLSALGEIHTHSGENELSWCLCLTLYSFFFVYRDHIYTVDIDTSHTEEIYCSKVSSFKTIFLKWRTLG